MKLLGIDIGTTSICGVLTDSSDGKVLRTRTEDSHAFLSSAFPWEKIQDVEKMLRIARSICDDLIGDGADCIGVTGQMHGIVYYDENGDAVSPLCTWQDGRGNQPYRNGKTYAEFLGIPSGYGHTTDFYNRENGLRPASAVGFCTIHDYFVMKLTGRKTPLIHASNAASFGGFDLVRGCFSRDFSGEVTSASGTAGTYRGIPVSCAIGDNQASVFGAVRKDTDILLNIGTGGQVSVVTDRVITGKDIECRPYIGGKYLAVGASLCGGRAYAMLERFYSDVVFYATGKRMELYEAMERMDDFPAFPMTADTRFDGTRTDPSLTGSLSGITTENFTPSALRQAFLSGMIGELYTMFTEMHTTGSALVGSGNGIRRNRTLVSIAESVFGLKMRIPVHREEAAFGAALFGALASGAESDTEKLKAVIRNE